jgi:hypothetical protein
LSRGVSLRLFAGWGGGGQREGRRVSIRGQCRVEVHRDRFFLRVRNVVPCHRSAGAPYIFSYNHRKQVAEPLTKVHQFQVGLKLHNVIGTLLKTCLDSRD